MAEHIDLVVKRLQLVIELRVLALAFRDVDGIPDVLRQSPVRSISVAIVNDS